MQAIPPVPRHWGLIVINAGRPTSSSVGCRPKVVGTKAHGLIDDLGSLAFLRHMIAEAHSHAAESECRHFQVALSEFALLHSAFSFELGTDYSDLSDAMSIASNPLSPATSVRAVSISSCTHHLGLLHFQFRISGMSWPCLSMYCLCSINLSLSCCFR